MKRTGLLISVPIVLVDQLTKMLAQSYFAAQPVEIFPFFNFVLVWNKGVSFGMFSQSGGAGPYLLVALSVVIIAFLFIWQRRMNHRPLIIAVWVIIGGAIGNVIDRLRFGAVVDFLDFHIGSWHYPAFNIADSCIVLGIAFIIIDSLWWEPKRRKLQKHE